MQPGPERAEQDREESRRVTFAGLLAANKGQCWSGNCGPFLPSGAQSQDRSLRAVAGLPWGPTGN